MAHGGARLARAESPAALLATHRGVAISEDDLAELRADMGVLNERRWQALEWEMPADEAYFFPGSVPLRFRYCFDGSFEVALRREEH